MPKKKAMGKAQIILANNPKNDNSCQCFVRNVPSVDWIIIAHYPTMAQCRKVMDQCSAFFMGMPLTKAQQEQHMMAHMASKKKANMGAKKKAHMGAKKKAHMKKKMG